MYESGSSPSTLDEDRRCARIVRKTIQTEACRGLFGPLRSQLKPTACTGPSYVNIPVHDEDTECTTSTHYQYLQAPPDSIIWQKAIDKETIERHVLDYNSESFCAAASSPCGSGIIHDELALHCTVHPLVTVYSILYYYYPILH